MRADLSCRRRGSWASRSVLAVMVLSSASSTRADELRDASNSTAELCGGTFYSIPNGTTNDPYYAYPYYSTQHAQAKDAVGNAGWMILREGVWNKLLHFSSNCTQTWSSDWFDGSEESFNSWYETLARVSDWCDASAVGCTGYDWEFPGWSWIIAADTAVARDAGWGTINQDTINDYLETSQGCMSFENVWMHELGHAYGLDHTSSQISTMGNGSFCVKNINITQAYSDQFWPLDNAQMRSRYEVSGGATRRNFSVSVYRRDSIGVDGRDNPGAQFLTTSSPWGILTYNYSLMRYFAASTGSVGVQFRFVRDGLVPSFSWSTKQWTWPADTSTYTGDIDVTASGTADTAVTWPYTVSVHRNELPGPVGSWYRMWMLVDYNYSWNETDEGDNMIPTSFFVVKQ